MPTHRGNFKKRARLHPRQSSGPSGKPGGKFVSRCPFCVSSVSHQGYSAETDVGVEAAQRYAACRRGHSWSTR